MISGVVQVRLPVLQLVGRVFAFIGTCFSSGRLFAPLALCWWASFCVPWTGECAGATRTSSVNCEFLDPVRMRTLTGHYCHASDAKRSSARSPVHVNTQASAHAAGQEGRPLHSVGSLHLPHRSGLWPGTLRSCRRRSGGAVTGARHARAKPLVTWHVPVPSARHRAHLEVAGIDLRPPPGNTPACIARARAVEGLRSPTRCAGYCAADSSATVSATGGRWLRLPARR